MEAVRSCRHWSLGKKKKEGVKLSKRTLGQRCWNESVKSNWEKKEKSVSMSEGVSRYRGKRDEDTPEKNVRKEGPRLPREERGKRDNLGLTAGRDSCVHQAPGPKRVEPESP